MTFFPPKKPLHHFLFSPWGFHLLLSLSLPSLVFDCLLDFHHPSEHEVVWLCISLMTNWAYFHVLLYIAIICITSLGNFLQMLCPCFSWVICLSCCWVFVSVLCIFQVQVPYQVYEGKYFLYPVCYLCTFLMVFFKDIIFDNFGEAKLSCLSLLV